jgi:hypothetical protein
VVAFEWPVFGCMLHAVLVDGAAMLAESAQPADLR